jgi:hypothetical protein
MILFVLEEGISWVERLNYLSQRSNVNCKRKIFSDELALECVIILVLQTAHYSTDRNLRIFHQEIKSLNRIMPK